MKAIQVTGVALCLGLSSLGYSQGGGDFTPAVVNKAATLAQDTQSLVKKSRKPEPPEPTESEELFDSFDPMERARLQQQRRPLACAVLAMPESHYGHGFCVLQTRYPLEKIVVEKSISGANCARGITYGLEGQNRIWFDTGCRFTFRIKTRKGAALSGTTIDCQSLDFQLVTCPTKLRIRYVRMAEQYSREGMCHPGLTDYDWGFKDDLVWVTQGCRGRFYVEGNVQ